MKEKRREEKRQKADRKVMWSAKFIIILFNFSLHGINKDVKDVFLDEKKIANVSIYI